MKESGLEARRHLSGGKNLVAYVAVALFVLVSHINASSPDYASGLARRAIDLSIEDSSAPEALRTVFTAFLDSRDFAYDPILTLILIQSDEQKTTQRVSVHSRGKSLLEVLNEIAEQASLGFKIGRDGLFFGRCFGFDEDYVRFTVTRRKGSENGPDLKEPYLKQVDLCDVTLESALERVRREFGEGWEILEIQNTLTGDEMKRRVTVFAVDIEARQLLKFICISADVPHKMLPGGFRLGKVGH